MYMKTKNLFKYVMFVAAVSIIFTACRKKEKEDEIDSDTAGASDNALAEGTFNDASNIADQAAGGSLSSYLGAYNNGSGERGLLSTCASITRDTVSVPHTFTVDFGSTNCLCGDGRYRRGQIVVSYSGHYRDSASMHSITFVNYFVNNNQVTGTHSVTNMGHNSNHNLYFNISINASVIKANNGGTITYTSTRVREWVAGESTIVWNDDVYSITGNASGSHSNGHSYTATITSALKVHLNCHWIESGVLELVPSGKPTRTIDFGTDGNCDHDATVTINGHVYNITM